MNKERRFIAFGENAGLENICERAAQGEIPTCPKCRKDLLLLLSWEEARKLGLHPGIFCPEDRRHFEIFLNLTG